jgi:hypothetical protein
LLILFFIDDVLHSKIEKGLFTNPLMSKSDLLSGDYDPKIVNNITRANGSDHRSRRNSKCKASGDKWFIMKHVYNNKTNH